MMDFRWIRDLWLGKRLLGQFVERATEVINNGNTTVFTVSGGRVIVTSIVGEITGLMGGGATNINLRAVPTVGTPQDMSLNAGLNIANYAQGDLLGITGVPTDAMIPAVSGGTIPAQTIGVVVKAGIIRLVSSAANAGLCRWTLHYIPLDAGATVVATGP